MFSRDRGGFGQEGQMGVFEGQGGFWAGGTNEGLRGTRGVKCKRYKQGKSMDKQGKSRDKQGFSRDMGCFRRKGQMGIFEEGYGQISVFEGQGGVGRVGTNVCFRGTGGG